MVLWCFVVILASTSLIAKEASSRDKEENDSKGKIKLYGHVDSLAEYCVGSGIMLESRQLPAKILKVRPGSPAFYAGVCADDTVLKGNVTGNRFSLNISRKGKEYLVSLRARADNKPIQNINRESNKLNDSTDWQELRKYDVTILLDRSGSMTRDLGNKDLTRWQWVQPEINGFARSIEKNCGSRMTLGLFNEDYQLLNHATADEITRAVDRTIPVANTDLSGVLKAALDAYRKGDRKKPMLLAIISDGLTANQPRVKSILGAAIAELAPEDKLRVVVFQTGYTNEGAIFFADLTKTAGAKKTIMMLLFDDLTEKGLLGGLLEAIRK